MNTDTSEKREFRNFLVSSAFYYFLAYAGGIISIHKKALELIDRCVRKRDVILEIGCGWGFFTKVLHEKVCNRVTSIISIDVEADRVKHAATYCGAGDFEEVTVSYMTDDRILHLGMGTAINLKDLHGGRVDMILCIMVAHHLSPAERERMIDQIYRSLNRGRKAFIVDHGKPTNAWGRLLWFMFRKHCYADHCIESVIQMAKKRGFVNCTIRHTQFGWIHHLTIEKPS